MKYLWDFQDHQINSIVLKPTDFCNLKCTYCYQDDRNLSKIKKMDLQLIEKIISDYFSYADKYAQDNSLYIAWHGGEPLITGRDYFYQVMQIQKKFTDKKHIILNSVQTNGTLIDDKMAGFLKSNSFTVGVSLDGTKEIHDNYRIYRNGKGSFEEVMRGIQKLVKNQVPVSAISVISKKSLKHIKDIYNMFKTLCIIEVDFVPSFLQESPDNLSIQEYTDFMIELFDLYYSDKDRNFGIRFIDDLLRLIAYRKTESPVSIGCELAGRCGENLSILSNGDVYPCDCLSSIDPLCIGNIKTMTFEEIISSNLFKTFQNKVNIIPEECNDCKFFSICKAGCFNRRIKTLEAKSFVKDIYCEARKNIIAHVLEKLKTYKNMDNTK